MANNLNTILTILMEKNSISDSVLSKETLVPIPTIIRMRTKKNSNPTVNTLKPIADYFKVTIDQLLGVTSFDENLTIVNPIYRIVPILDKNSIPLWLKGKLKKESIKPWTKTSTQDEKSYAIKCKTFTLNRKFSDDSIMIISPSINPTPGDSIIISNKTFKNPTLLDLCIKDGAYFISPLDKPENLSPLKLPFDFYGVVSEVFYHTKEAQEPSLISNGIILAPFMMKCR